MSRKSCSLTNQQQSTLSVPSLISVQAAMKIDKQLSSNGFSPRDVAVEPKQVEG